MGDSLHPGGLQLTSYLAQKMELRPGERVLDVGSGWGASAVHLAKQYGCSVLGVSLEETGVKAAQAAAQKQGVEALVSFVRGDVCSLQLEAGGFDAVIMECTLSIITDKQSLLGHLRSALRPGGRIGVTDVTVNGELPPGLQGTLSAALCVSDALSLSGYQSLVESAGFSVTSREDVKPYVEKFLHDIKGKLLLAELGSKLGKLPISPSLIDHAKDVFAQVQHLVQQGVLGYGLLVGQRG
jgi:ubiquinone/menaquinone biosynthesis C-methylase UbiE